MTKGAKMLEKEPQPKPTGGLKTHDFSFLMFSFLDIDHSTGTTTISGIPNNV